MKKCIVLIGPPCSGKSTIGKQLASDIHFKYISSGDIARDMAKTDSTTRDNLMSGKMAQESEMRNRISELLSEHNFVILDGFPRFTDQYKWLMSRFSDYKFMFVVIDVATPVLLTRAIQRERVDDVVIMDRLKYYVENTSPMVGEIYRDLHSGILRITNTVVSDTVNKIKEECVSDSSWV